MIPNGALSSSPAPGGILSPDDLFRYRCPWIDYERGGAAIGDTSQGFDVYTWRLTYNTGDPASNLLGCRSLSQLNSYQGLILDVLDATVINPIPLFPTGDVTEVSLAFDQNMRPTIAYVEGGAASLYWYDTAAERQVTTPLGYSVQFPRVALDDKRQTQSGTSDVVLVYLWGGQLCFRAQRDRFKEQYVLKRTNATSIGRVGMGDNWRFHIELIFDDRENDDVWYPEPIC